MIRIIILSFVFQTGLFAQNIDLLSRYSAGRFQSMAGSGVAAADELGSLDLNPAGSASIRTKGFSVSLGGRLYSYALYRQNIGIRAGHFNQKAFSGNFEHFLYGLPVLKRLYIGAGVIQKYNPFLQNVNRAITWSNMFNQDTHGSFYAAVLSGGFKVTEQFSAGITLYSYFGKIFSKVTGFFHGEDLNKWAELENSCSGLNMRFGLQYRLAGIFLGAAVETPYNMRVLPETSLSSDEKYAGLLPEYEKTIWKQPLIIHAGIGVNLIRNLLLTLDYEHRDYKSSSIQIPLFEVGLPPKWRDINIFRTGLELRPRVRERWPLRIGYAHIPQMHCSINATGWGYALFTVENGRPNEKHLLTAGTSFKFYQLSINMTLAFSFLKYNRRLETDHLVLDDYSEHCYSVSLEMIKTSRN